MAERRCQLACEQQGAFEENEDVIERLLMDVKLLSIDIYLLLLDRGFFSSSVINSLNKLHQTFLMPAVKNRGIRKAIMEHIEGRRKCISEYRMHSSSDSAEASFTIVILPKKGSEKEEETDPATDRYIVFATNIPEGRILWNINRIPEDYRKS
jgi:hypothetical protein